MGEPISGHWCRHSGSLLATEPRILEIKVLLTDYYLAIERDAAPGIERTRGFAGTALLDSLRPIGAGVSVKSAPVKDSPAAVDAHRDTLASLLAGLLVDRTPGLAVKPPSASDSEGTSLDVVLPSGLVGRLELDDQSFLPVRLRFMDKVSLPKAALVRERQPVPQSGVVTPGVRVVEPLEVTVSFDDHRSVAGYVFPHRIRRSARGLTLEDVRFTQIEVNPQYSPEDFKVRTRLQEQELRAR